MTKWYITSSVYLILSILMNYSINNIMRITVCIIVLYNKAIFIKSLRENALRYITCTYYIPIFIIAALLFLFFGIL